jgi:hypothetical protein
MFCDRVLQEADGTLSAIRIIDRHTHVAIGPDAPHDMPPMVLSTWVLIMLKPGDARGRYTVRVRPEAPSGLQLPHLDLPVNFMGVEEQGVNIVLPLQMQLAEEGLYWFDVMWMAGDDDGSVLLTRMPLRVLYQPQPTSPQPGEPAS